MEDLKRYALFEYEDFYPGGGWEDFVGSFDTTQEAFGRASIKRGHRNIQVIDLRTGEEIKRPLFAISPNLRAIMAAACAIKPKPARIRVGREIFEQCKATADPSVMLDSPLVLNDQGWLFNMLWVLDASLEPNEYEFN